MVGDGVGGVLFEESLAGIEAVDVARVGEGPVEVFGLPGGGVDLGGGLADFSNIFANLTPRKRELNVRRDRNLYAGCQGETNPGSPWMNKEILL